MRPKFLKNIFKPLDESSGDQFELDLVIDEPSHRTPDDILGPGLNIGQVPIWYSSWANDISEMHHKFGMRDCVKDMDKKTLAKLLAFRADFLQEELDELNANIDDPEEVVDALIDLVVVAIGTLDLFEIDANVAWSAVREANISKEAGVNPTRPNEFGAPDLIKPEGWKSPSHEGNHGLLPKG